MKHLLYYKFEFNVFHVHVIVFVLETTFLPQQICQQPELKVGWWGYRRSASDLHGMIMRLMMYLISTASRNIYFS